MSQLEIEIILARQLSEYLTLPIFIVDPDGSLLFYNETAEDILGQRYNETGPMPASEWSTIFEPFQEDGQPLDPSELPLIIAMTQKHAAHKSFWIKGMDKTLRKIEVTAFPLCAQGNRFLGALAIFWEVPE